MLKKKFLYSITLLLIAFPSFLYPKRRSRIKRAERREMQKNVVITGDQKLSAALSRQTKVMNFEEALLAKDYYMKGRDLDMAIKCGVRALAVGGNGENDQEIMRKIRFELAEIYLEKQNYKEAEKYAQEYQKFYPGSAETIKAEYITVRANFLAQLPSDREQGKTHETIRLAHEFLDNHSEDSQYIDEVKAMLDQSYQTLIRSEINIIMTHLHNYNHTKVPGMLDASHKRLAYIKEKYLPHAPATEKRLLELEIQLAELSGKQPKPMVSAEKKSVTAYKKPKPEKGFFDRVTGIFAEDNDSYFA